MGKAMALVVAMLAGLGLGYWWVRGGDEAAMRAWLGGQAKIEEEAPLVWPPAMWEPYPDLPLIDHTGRPFHLSDYKGRIIVIEPIGMNCEACNAYAGGAKYGGYAGTKPQSNLEAFEKLMPLYTKTMTLNDPRLLYVQLLLYDETMDAPQVDDARQWAKHFHLEDNRNILVAVPKQDMRGDASFAMIPGFQLIDRSFRLRADSTGHHPQDDLYYKLLPMIPQLARQ